MLDLVLYAPTKAKMAAFGKARGLLDADGNTVQGVRYVWWQESGKFMTQKGTYDAEGNEIEAPTFLPGFVLLMRFHTSFFDADKIADEGEQWARSKIVKYIKDNGTPGTMGSIPYYELDDVRIFRPADVLDFLASRELPGHIWVGGNVY